MPQPTRDNPHDGDDEPLNERPNEDDATPEEPDPPRRYTRAWMRERLGVTGDVDE